MRPRAFAAALVGLVLALLLVRGALVHSDKPKVLELAERLWPSNPSILHEQAMREVGEAAAAGQPPPAATLDRLAQLSRNAPLSPDSFLVEAAIADKKGDLRRAEALLVEARRREPRSAAARYLLSDLYLRTGRVAAAMQEMAELSRLLPGSSVQLIPALADFARSAGAGAELRTIFAENPRLEQPVLNTLAADPANAELILSVVKLPYAAADGGSAPWETRLLDGIVATGDYARAHSIWSRLVGISGSTAAGLFNPAFHKSAAPPPFNWNFVSSSAGFAEPSDGSLRILYYGRDNIALATQLLLLPPGHYRLTVPVSSATGASGELAWTVSCQPGGSGIASLPIPAKGGAERLASDFTVPAHGCGAQQLQLNGIAQDSPGTADVQILPLAIERIGQ